MAAKAKIPLKKLQSFIVELSVILAPLKPVEASVKYVGSFDVDKQGAWKLGGKADLADVIALVGGAAAPVGISGEVGAQHDTDGSADLELWIRFG